MLFQAKLTRMRRVAVPIAVADAVNPAVMDRVRNRAFGMFDDSSAAKGSENKTEKADLDKRRETFLQATRGIHW